MTKTFGVNSCTDGQPVEFFGHRVNSVRLWKSWLHPTGDEAKIAEMTPPSHCLVHCPRHGTTGGGVAIIHRSSLALHVNKNSMSHKSFGKLDVLVTSGQSTVRLVCIYRPPPSARNKLTDDNFINEIGGLFCSHDKDNIVYLGDFNIHFNSPQKPNVKRMLDLLHSHSLKQIVSEPTHKSGNILDWIISSPSCGIIKNILVQDRQMSDHSVVALKLSLMKSPVQPTIIKCRNLKDIDAEDLKDSDLVSSPPSSVGDHVTLYTIPYTSLLDKHAPSVEKKRHLRPNAPWYSKEVFTAKRRRRRAERQWRNSRLEVHRQIFRASRNQTTSVIAKANRGYCLQEIENCAGKPARLYKFIRQLLEHPPNDEVEQYNKNMADSINEFFVNKIDKIREGLSE
ncbi:uncharacterized protein LOC124274113 [Haliotis rubra]|uniref:uncharacterized protein LOC124274113 n=1 Tax=Haliotis rubra TaxID=36100 RepID=UPI001EE5FB19|nr:uncharacterized protein LOC124274113 [Haliotis rubra]